MDKFVPVEHPSEPLEADKPTWCPRPEPCIMHVSNTPFLPSYVPSSFLKAPLIHAGPQRR
jgi:hypothetical protein